MSTMRANIAKGGTMKVAKGVRGVRSVRAKASAVPLPDLPYDYGALEPYISGDIMKVRARVWSHALRAALCADNRIDAFFLLLSFGPLA
mmetsp:Transcript_4636/g.13835  ORF Transcript_4636/g.13835 Transcript_4636/m.13835 type:complete len:89 (+) Transcript_4636:144-410(+)